MRVKNLIMIIGCLMLIQFNISAQTWCPPGAIWIYKAHSWEETVSLKMEYQKDTIIDDILVKKIITTRYLKNETNGKTEVFPEGFELMYNRNDTIFWFDNNGFVMLYDFNAKVGSKWKINANPDFAHPCNDKPNFDSLLVTEVGYSDLFKQDLLFYTAQFSSWDFGNSIIKWIGSSGYPFPLPYGKESESCIPPDYYSAVPNQLVCYSYTGSQNYCAIIDGVNKEVFDSEVSIYPNPASEVVYVKSDELLDCQITVKNVFGDILYTEIISKKGSINISDLLDGIYFLSVQPLESVTIKPQSIKLIKK